MTRALKLLIVRVPRESATKMGAVIDNADVVKSAIGGNNQISGFSC
jgi:hypothetical protein